MRRSTQLIAGGLVVATLIAAAAVLAARRGGGPGSNSEAGALPTEGPLMPISTLIAHVLDQKTPPAVFQTALSAPPRPAGTRNPALYTDTIDAAISRAARQLTGESGGVTHGRMSSLRYVQTTAGKALALLQPAYLRNLTSYGLANDTPVWAFVAHGSFRPAVWDRIERPAGAPESLPTMWVVVPQGGYDFALGDPTSAPVDLNTIGRPIEILRGQAAGTDLDHLRDASLPAGSPSIQVGAPSLVGGAVRVPVSTTGTGLAPYTGFSVHLRWNASVFTFSSASSAGTVLPGSPFCPAAQADADGAGVVFACAATGGNQTTTAGLLATIVLTPAGTGCSPLHLFTYGGADNGDGGTGTYTIDAATNIVVTATADGSGNQAGQVC